MHDVALSTVIAWMASLGPTNEPLAAAIVTAANEYPLFAEPRGPEHTAALLTAIAYQESAGTFSSETRGDQDTSFCALQVNVRGRTPEGWTGAELATDTNKCVRAALRVLRESFSRCRHNQAPERTAGYCSGRCDAGLRAARKQYDLAEHLFRSCRHDQSQ